MPIFSPRPKYKYQVGICCIAKNENPYFEEWIQYHLSIGVTRFYIYDNNSSIPVKTSVSKYVDEGIVVTEVIEGEKMQLEAHKRCLDKYGKECQWIAFIDVDEFIVPKTLNGNLFTFLNAYEKFGGLAIHWLVFGSNGHQLKPSDSQLSSFTKRSLKSQEINGHIKSIVQPRYVESVPGNPHQFNYKHGKYCVNENFEIVTTAITTHTSNKIQLNHYFFRSIEEFRSKIARGRADGGKYLDIEKFLAAEKDANIITDESVLEVSMLLKN